MNRYIIICFLFFISFSTYAQEYITKASALADIDFYFEKLQRVHYNPYLFVKEADYLAAIETMKQEQPDSLTKQDLTRRFYTLTALLQDGHTTPNFIQPQLSPDLKAPQFFPYQLVFGNGQAYISEAVSDSTGIPAGALVLSINNTPTEKLRQEFEAYIGGNPAFKSEMAQRFYPYFLYLNGIVAPFNIEYRSPEGSTATTEVAHGVPFMVTIERYMPGVLKENEFRILNDEFGYISFSRMGGDWQDWSALLEKAVDSMRSRNIQKLIVDIRENSGGNSLLGEVLFGFITDKPFLFQSRRDWKVSEEYKEYLLSNNNTEHEYLQYENGTVYTNQHCEANKSRMEVENPFPGEVFLLTGPFTFSSGHMVADAAKEFGLATLVGQPTGEHTIDFGEVLSLTLPNSGILINFSTSMDYGSDCEQTQYVPVHPDIEVAPTVEAKITGRDVVLEYVLEHH